MVTSKRPPPIKPSRDAMRIDRAHKRYKAAIGTAHEKAAYAALQAVVAKAGDK